MVTIYLIVSMLLDCRAGRTDLGRMGSLGLRYILSMASKPVILSIAGYDPSSGAGITADVKTAAAMGCYAVTCITALTVQSTQGVFGVEPVRPEVVRETLYRLAEDVDPGAVRIGMLGSGEVARVVAEFLREVRLPNVVLDPVLRSSSGTELIDAQGVEVILRQFLPLCDVITPNYYEANRLAGLEFGAIFASNSYQDALPEVRQVASKLHELGARGVVITGGHLPEANDYLSSREGNATIEQVLPGSRIESQATHGTGCAFAAALACGLARGFPLAMAAQKAKDFVRHAIYAAYQVGRGTGPMNHLFRLPLYPED